MAILDLIQHPDEHADEIVRRVPESGSGEFRLGSQLVVRESQRAVFVRDGKALDVFGPGRHTLSTNNIPLLTGLLGPALRRRLPLHRRGLLRLRPRLRRPQVGAPPSRSSTATRSSA
jgi:membrane protease subunit (stomatin/prohibitin family)